MKKVCFFEAISPPAHTFFRSGTISGDNSTSSALMRTEKRQNQKEIISGTSKPKSSEMVNGNSALSIVNWLVHLLLLPMWGSSGHGLRMSGTRKPRGKMSLCPTVLHLFLRGCLGMTVSSLVSHLQMPRTVASLSTPRCAIHCLKICLK